jgi:hypothetical protein
MNFTLHQLYVFQEVVRQKSVTRAAEGTFYDATSPIYSAKKLSKSI